MRHLPLSSRQLVRAPRAALAAALLLALALAAACQGREGSTEASVAADGATGSAGSDAAYAPHLGVVGGAAGKVAGQAEEQMRRSSDMETAVQAAPPAAPPAPARDMSGAQGPDAPFGSEAATSMLIRTGMASVEVTALEPAISAVQALATRYGGYVASSEVQTGRDQVRSAMLEIKVPSARYDALLAGLAPLGKVESVTTSSEDVGEEYTDLGARLANAERLEERLIALLAARTGKLEEVLSVERELARVREQIERFEGRRRYLRARASLSTLRLSLHEPMPIVGAPGDNPIGDAFRDAWRNFVAVVAGIIALAGGVLPLLVLGFVAWLVARRWLPRRAEAGPPAGGD